MKRLALLVLICIVWGVVTDVLAFPGEFGWQAWLEEGLWSVGAVILLSGLVAFVVHAIHRFDRARRHAALKVWIGAAVVFMAVAGIGSRFSFEMLFTSVQVRH